MQKSNFFTAFSSRKNIFRGAFWNTCLVTRIPCHPNVPRPSEENGGSPLPQSRTSPEGITQQVAKALAHPLRVRILSSLHKGISSPNQLAQELGEPLGNVSYHVKTLLEYDCVELVKTEPRRGAVEHFYRATDRAFLSDSDWAKIPASARKGISGSILESIGQSATEAMAGGTIEARSDSHLSDTPLLLDEKGWKDLNKVLAETVKEATKIQKEAGKRLSSKKDGITSKLAIMHFEVPTAKGKKKK
ncbi:MAG: ArsR/SmtB family transcription factor [Solirubrobacterales bacterium]